jgi:hypothetical protein
LCLPGSILRDIFQDRDHLPQLTALAKRYADRRPNLADLCLIRGMEMGSRLNI